MYCKYCGNQISDGSRFCRSCGARLDDVSPQAQGGYTVPEKIRRPEQQQDRYQQQGSQAQGYRQQTVQEHGKSVKPKKKKGRGIRILLFLMLFVIIGCAGLYFIGTLGGPVGSVEPSWVKTVNIQDVDPGPLYAYLDDEQKELYTAVRSALEGKDYGWFPYKNGEMDDTVAEVTVALVNDYPLVGDLSVYVTTSSHTKGGKSEMRIETLREFAPDYNEMMPIIKEVAGSLTGTTSEKVRQISEFLCENIEYDETAELAYSTYGALVNGRAVCQGYSAAFNAICQEAGIRSYAVSGTTKLSFGRTGNHVWNIVKLEDGNWYELDLTSTDAYNSGSYYCIPTSKMSKHHERGGMMGKLTRIVPQTQE